MTCMQFYGRSNRGHTKASNGGKGGVPPFDGMDPGEQYDDTILLGLSKTGVLRGTC